MMSTILRLQELSAAVDVSTNVNITTFDQRANYCYETLHHHQTIVIPLCFANLFFIIIYIAVSHPIDVVML